MPAAGLRMARVSDRLLLLITVYYSLGQHLGGLGHCLLNTPACKRQDVCNTAGAGELGCFKP